MMTRTKEHHWHILLYHPDKSAVAEHSINLDNCIQLQDISILAKIFRHISQIIRDATEINLYPNNMEREDGFSLSKSQKPLICILEG
jgi:hypothetical protein